MITRKDTMVQYIVLRIKNILTVWRTKNLMTIGYILCLIGSKYGNNSSWPIKMYQLMGITTYNIH